MTACGSSIDGFWWPFGCLNRSGLSGLVVPRLAVGVGRGGFLAAAELLGGLRLGFFLPLVHLDFADQPHARGADREIGIARRRVRRHRAADMDELALVGRIDGVGGNRNDGAGAFGQRTRRGHRAALVPEQQHHHADDQQSPITTAPTALRRRANHDVEVVTVKELLIWPAPEKKQERPCEARESALRTRCGYRSFSIAAQLAPTSDGLLVIRRRIVFQFEITQVNTGRVRRSPGTGNRPPRRICIRTVGSQAFRWKPCSIPCVNHGVSETTISARAISLI